MTLKKRLEALEGRRGEHCHLRFPKPLVHSLPDYLIEFHDSGELAKVCTEEEARQAFPNKIGELIDIKYEQVYKKNRSH